MPFSSPRPHRPLLFIPTYNERENVEKIFREIKALGLELDLLFLDDNSPDGTGAILDRLAAEHPDVRVIHRPGKAGIGGAHQEGIRWAYDHGYSMLLTMDCDFTHPPQYVPDFIKNADNCAVVVGSRHLRKDSLQGWNIFRSCMTRLGYFMTKRLLRLPYDATGAYRLYRLDKIPRSVFEQIEAKGYSFFFESLYALYLKKFQIREIPITLPARASGHSKMTAKDAGQSAGQLFSLYLRWQRGPAIRIARCGLAVIGLVLGLYGIRWGLPSRVRVLRVIPPELDTPDFRTQLADSWIKLHQRLGENLMLNPESFATFSGIQDVAVGWRTPPPLLMPSIRSFYVRSAYEDEQSLLISLSRMRPWRLQFNPHLFVYGGTYIYSLGAWIALGAATGLVALHTSLAPYLAFPDQMAGLYTQGRLFSVVFYLACAFMLLRIGRKHLGLGTGALAALFFLLCPGPVVVAHILKMNTFWPFFVLLTLDFSADLLTREEPIGYARAGASSGLAVGSFPGAWPACFIVAVAAAIRAARSRKVAAEARGLMVAAACSAAAFLLTNPYWVLDFGSVMGELRMESGVSTFNILNPLIFMWHPLRHSVTGPLFLLMLAGAAWAARRGRKEPVLWLCLAAFLLGLSFMVTVAGVLTTQQIRYFIGWLAIGLLLAARAAVDFWRAYPRWRFLSAVVLGLLTVHVGCVGLSYAYNFHVDATPRSTQARAGRWIEAHIPAGSQLGMLRLPQPSNAPYFRYDRYALRFIAPQILDSLDPTQLPPYMVLVAPDTDRGSEPAFARYERIAEFDSPSLFPWIKIDPTATIANPRVDIYRLKTSEIILRVLGFYPDGKTIPVFQHFKVAFDVNPEAGKLG